MSCKSFSSVPKGGCPVCNFGITKKAFENALIANRVSLENRFFTRIGTVNTKIVHWLSGFLARRLKAIGGSARGDINHVIAIQLCRPVEMALNFFFKIEYALACRRVRHLELQSHLMGLYKLASHCEKFSLKFPCGGDDVPQQF